MSSTHTLAPSKQDISESNTGRKLDALGHPLVFHPHYLLNEVASTTSMRSSALTSELLIFHK